MKRKLFFPFFVVLLCLCGRMPIYADNDVSMHVTNRYKYYDGKKTGRQVIISTSQTITSASICHSGSWQQVPLKNMEAGQYELLLPDPIGVKQPDTLTVRLMEQKKTICERILTVGKMRHWEVLIFHHSHVDIGYTQTQKVVEFIHRQNIEQAIELSEKTKDYPDDARFRWNTEVSWPMERYLKTASPEKRERALQAIRQGSISVDMSYLNTNTSAAHEPELMELYSASHRIEELTGRSTHTMVQVDVPGFTWGIPALSKLTGVRYVLSLPNAADRVGRARELDLRPMYWLAPDGVNKVLFVQGGPYCMAAHWKRNPWFFDNLGVKDTTLLPKVVRTDNPRAIFLDGELDANLPMLENNPAYVYDVYPQPWCMSDNVPIDADLPDAVKSWNEEFAFPHLRISNSSEIMAAYERYADHIPTVSGDYTEYWTDGLGTSAYHTGRHREVKERLMQAEILSCITGSPLPDEECSEAWRYALLGTEHTWAYIYPDQPISDEEKTAYGEFSAAIWYNIMDGKYTTEEALSQIDLKQSPFYIACYGVQPELVNRAYQIGNVDELRWVAYQVNSGNGKLKACLKNDIDMSTIGSWIPIGTSDKPFAGTFDGQGHAFVNFTMNVTSGDAGLFGYISGATVRNFTIDGTMVCAGAVNAPIASAKASLIEGVHSSLRIDATAAGVTHTAGVVGDLQENSVVDRCAFDGSISVGTDNYDCFGGIAGYTNTGTITNCANYGTITFAHENCYAGGMFGYVNNTNFGGFSNCLAVGTVKRENGESKVAGALCGWLRNYNASVVANNYWLAGCAERASGIADLEVNKRATTEELASGAVCFALNQGQAEDVWFQTIGEDPYPVLDATHGRVVFKDGKYVNDGSGVETIHNVQVIIHNGENEVYDLSGRKVSNDSLPKGVYIVNGQKTLVK